MPNDDRPVTEGAKAFLAWREANPDSPISHPNWYGSTGPGGVQVKGRNRIDFSGADLSRLLIMNAFAEGLNLRGAVITNTVFEEGDFSRADFSEATFRNTRFNKTILTNAKFDGATFVNCNLNRANLVGASFRVKEITEAVVYGIAAWDLATDGNIKQSKLVIEHTYEFYSDLVAAGRVPLMVDDIELAQFVYFLSNHKRMLELLNTLGTRVVLLLGAFKNGLDRLYSIRDSLIRRRYMPMIFDFARPDSLNLTETAVAMAGLAKFVVADLSGPSVPAELAAIFASFKKPVLAIGNPFSLFLDLRDKTPVLAVGDVSEIEGKLAQLEALHADRIVELANRDRDAALLNQRTKASS